MSAELRIAGATYPPVRSVLLCATRRVGSTLLCDLLSTTGVLGHPKEPFSPDAEQACADAWSVPHPDDDVGAYLEAALRNGTSPNGVFATKIMWDHLPRWDARLAATAGAATSPSLLELVPSPLAIVLVRGNKVAAAVSELRARRSGSWSSRTGADDMPPEVVTPRDVVLLDRYHRAHHDAASEWPGRLRRLGIPYTVERYEDWSREPLALVHRIADGLGVRAAAGPPRSHLAVQRDDWNARVEQWWRTRDRALVCCPQVT